jgi:hypothetical protein
MSKKTLLQDLANIVSVFLKKHGGMSNGYNTYTQGKVRERTFSAIDISVNNDDLTLNDIKKLGRDLYSQLNDALPANFFQRYSLDVVASHVESGCWRTEVCIVEKASVVLW